MTSPFEDQGISYSILINGEGQYSLWPATLEVPGGWTVAFAQRSRQECLDYVNRVWTSLRMSTDAARKQ